MAKSAKFKKSLPMAWMVASAFALAAPLAEATLIVQNKEFGSFLGPFSGASSASFDDIIAVMKFNSFGSYLTGQTLNSVTWKLIGADVTFDDEGNPIITANPATLPTFNISVSVTFGPGQTAAVTMNSSLVARIGTAPGVLPGAAAPTLFTGTVNNNHTTGTSPVAFTTTNDQANSGTGTGGVSFIPALGGSISANPTNAAYLGLATINVNGDVQYSATLASTELKAGSHITINSPPDDTLSYFGALELIYDYSPLVTGTPLPATPFLLGSGLALLGFMRRRVA